MIITLSGKPCTGKSTTAEIFCEKYTFERVYAGAIFKQEAKKMGVDITDLTGSDAIVKIDYAVDEELKQIYENEFDKDILIESRTSWSFMPNAFNVFIDVDEDVMAMRLFNSDRSKLERGTTIEEAREKVMRRYNSDAERYKRIYNIDITDMKNYSVVIDNTNLTPEETADKIFEEYEKFLNNCEKI